MYNKKLNPDEINDSGDATQTIEVTPKLSKEEIIRRKRIEEIRAHRKPLHTRSKLKFPSRPGYVRYVFNDVGSTIRECEEAGWTVVKDSEIGGGDSTSLAASQIGNPVRRPVGIGVHGVLMEIPKEIYEEDQDEIQKRVTDIEKSKFDKGKEEGFYGDVKIKVST